MGQQQALTGTLMFSEVHELKIYSAFCVEKAFLALPKQRPSSAITYRVVGTVNHQRITLADFSCEKDASMICELFETASRH